MRDGVAGRSTAVGLLVVFLTGCSYSLPLGGMGRGRGAPVGGGRFDLGASVGVAPEIAGTLPLLLDSLGSEINPTSPRGAKATHAGALDPLGAAYGVADWLDLGLSFSRGLHAVARLGGDEHWGLSISPALFRYSSEDSGDPTPGSREGAITNLNLTALGAVYGPLADRTTGEVYGGVGVNRYSAWIRSDVGRVDHGATIPSVVGGVRLERRLPDSGRSGSWSGASLSTGFELFGAWVTERGSGRKLAAGGRIYFSITSSDGSGR